MVDFDQNRKLQFLQNAFFGFEKKRYFKCGRILRGSLALCVWKVAKTIITIPITLRVGLVT